MSTRSRIGIEYPGGSVASIYCHHDGYPEGVGVALAGGFASLEAAEELLGLGDLSGMGESIETCRAFHRDLGEAREHNRPLTHDDAEEYLARLASGDARYVYLFRDGSWLYASREDGSWRGLDGVGDTGTTNKPDARGAGRGSALRLRRHRRRDPGLDLRRRAQVLRPTRLPPPRLRGGPHGGSRTDLRGHVF